MTVFELEAVRARHGDALLLHAGTESSPQLIMIDGGAARTYEEWLRPRLLELRGSSDKPLEIKLLMISHIDDDHINGVLDLTQELREAKDEDEQPNVDINEIWHNSFADAIASEEPAEDAERTSSSLASLVKDDPIPGGRIEEQTRMVLESVRQGRKLRRDAGFLGIRVNTGFTGNLVLKDAAPAKPTRIGGVTLRILGPGQKEVDKLKERWRKDVKPIIEKERKLAEQSVGSLDTSVFNLASIVVLATRDASPGGSMLLTGDARGDHMLTWMEEEGDVLDDDGNLHVDLLKLPHHGSDRNVTPEFLRRVTADNYVVSGDGRHGNPEPQMFDWLFEERGDADFTIHMTYSPEELGESSQFDSDELKRVLDKHPGSRDRLRFPGATEPSISVAL